MRSPVSVEADHGVSGAHGRALVVLCGGVVWCEAAQCATGERHAVGVVHEPIQDRIATRGVADVVVPVFNRALAGHQRGAAAGATLNEFEQIAAFAVAERCQAPVVKDQDIGLRERLHDLAVRAVGARMHELFTQEAR